MSKEDPGNLPTWAEALLVLMAVGAVGIVGCTKFMAYWRIAWGR